MISSAFRSIQFVGWRGIGIETSDGRIRRGYRRIKFPAYFPAVPEGREYGASLLARLASLDFRFPARDEAHASSKL